LICFTSSSPVPPECPSAASILEGTVVKIADGDPWLTTPGGNLCRSPRMRIKGRGTNHEGQAVVGDGRVDGGGGEGTASAGRRLEGWLENTIGAKNGRITRGGRGVHHIELIGYFVEPAVGIEPTTC